METAAFDLEIPYKFYHFIKLRRSSRWPDRLMEHEVCVPDNWKFAALENISVNYNVNETRLDIGSRLDLSLSLFKVKKIYIYT